MVFSGTVFCLLALCILLGVSFSEQVKPASGGTPSRPYPERKESRVCGTTVAMGRLGGTSEAYRPSGPHFFHSSMLSKDNYRQTTPLKTCTDEYEYTPKYVDVTGTAVLQGNEQWISVRMDLSQGYDNNQRIGDTVRVKRVFLRGYGYVTVGGTGLSLVRPVRLLIIHDKSYIGGDGSTIAAALTSYFTEPTVSYPIPDFHSRFSVIAEAIDTDNSIGGYFSHYVDLDVRTHFDASVSATVPVQGAIYVCIVYDNNSSSDGSYLYARFFYEDC